MRSVWELLLLAVLCAERWREGEARLQKKHVMDVHPADAFNSTIVIGVPISYDIEDIYYQQGHGMIDAWELYVEWVNKRGGVSLKGQNVSLTLSYVEDFSTAEFVISAVDYLLFPESGARQAADFFLAPYSSGLTNVTATQTEPHGKILMAGGSVNTAVYADRSYTFGTLPPGPLYVTAAFRTLTNLEVPRVAIIRDTTEPICFEDDVLHYSAQYPDVQLYGYYQVDPSSPDYSSNIRTILQDLQANNVESLVGCSYVDLCIEIPTISKDIDYNPNGMMFIICDDAPDTIDTLGVDIEYILGMIPWVPSVNNIDAFVGWTSSEFRDKYYTAYSSEPTDVAASAFAGLEILVATIESTQSLVANDLVAELSTKTFPTFYANLTFDDNRQAVLDLLVRQSRFNESVLQTGLIVDPPHMATTEIVWPVPTWKERACVRDTDSCSSHGTCNSDGECVCDASYYGTLSECDTFCSGEISETGHCHYDDVYYIGGMVSEGYAYADEIKSVMRLSVELVNNYTDGWFDTVDHVQFELLIEDSKCTMSGGEDAMKVLNDWSINVSESGKTLDGAVGATCSDASKGAARYGNTIYTTQLSYLSTSVDLSDKDEYIYFGRTCYTDDIQAKLLVDVIDNLGIVPFISVVHGPGAFFNSLSDSIVSYYEEKGHIVLQAIEVQPSVSVQDYMDALDMLASLGTPATVLVFSPEEVAKILAAADEHPADVFRDNAMVWVGIENWVNIDDAFWNRQGMLGIYSPYLPPGDGSDIPSRFIDLWEQLDPSIYTDGDGDRSALSEGAMFAADAVFALALAFQQLVKEETGLEGDLLKKHTFTVLTELISFEGVSGYVNFLSNGNRDIPIYGIVNHGRDSWIQNGYVDATGTFIDDYSLLLWPDNSTGKLNGNEQLPLYCPAGSEPILVSSNPVQYSCSQCDTGEYKPEAGSHSCSRCPEGTSCDQLGVVIPCISPGYWRADPASDHSTGSSLGDFDNYKVYSCDFDSGCLGGCALNDTCSVGRIPSSVSCGVCADDYYLTFDGACLKCSSGDSYSPTDVSVIYICAVLSIGVGYFFLLKTLTKQKVNAVVASILSENLRAGSKDVTDTRPHLLLHVTSMAKRVGTTANITQKNFRDVTITGKIVLAFLQVMGAFFLLDLRDKSGDSGLYEFFPSYNFNVFRGNEHFIACSGVSSQIPSYYFIVLNAFFIPLLIVLIFGVTSFIFGWYYSSKIHHARRQKRIENPNEKYSGTIESLQNIRSTELNLQIRTIFCRVALWICLLIFPSVSSIMLSVFNCRDFGNSGTFIRVDNSVSCEDAEYSAYFTLAVVGIVIYIVGIPVFFFYAIRHRQDSMWESSSNFLHHGFSNEWKYYEIFDLLRKLLITSVSQFVGAPSSPSQVLFLLVVDLGALYLLASAKPYQNRYDDHLSTALTLIECCAFLYAFVIVSGVSETEDYNEVAMSNTLLFVIVFGLLVMTPYNFIMKIDYFKSRIDACFSKIVDPPVSRVRSFTQQGWKPSDNDSLSSADSMLDRHLPPISEDFRGASIGMTPLSSKSQAGDNTVNSPLTHDI